VSALITDWTSLWDLIEQRAAATPDARFAIDENDRALTFAEYRDACERAAAGLAALGVGEGTNVSWQLPTWLESMVLVGALARLGAVQNPMLPIYREREVGFIVKQTGAKLLIVPSVWRDFDFEAMARGIAADVPDLEVLVCDKRLPEGDPATLGPPAAGADDVFQEGVRTDGPWRWVFYTSGTTADPKGAKHTDKTVGASAHAMNLVLEMVPEDRNAMVFPFTHIGGIGWLFAGLMGGYQHVLVEGFVPVTTIPVLEKHRVTIAGAGTAFHMAYLGAQRDADHDLFPEARAFVGGGAAKPPAIHYEVKEELGGVGVVSGYGLTEVPILAMASVNDPDQKLADTEGTASPGVEIKVVTLDGKLAGPGEEGEIRAKGPNTMLGYVDSSLDADAFDEEGFFRSGDLGNLDADGFIAITGRLKDVIIRKGENISAKEVEDLLFTSPQVADAAVIGLPDPRSGERACAIVVPADPENPPTLKDLFDFLKGAGLMVQKIPEQLVILDTLPRNPTGKVLKHELRKQYADTSPGE
jgi:acyl-CoA synthetase (AMP-forming)/AMP-acid ligase II